jgi:hypothetical protein
MKLAIRIFALSVVVAGVAAAAASPKNAPMLSSHQSVTGAMPGPTCGQAGLCVADPNTAQ